MFAAYGQPRCGVSKVVGDNIVGVLGKLILGEKCGQPNNLNGIDKPECNRASGFK